MANKNTEINILQKEINKYEKKLSNLFITISTKDKEIYHLTVEIENVKSILENEKKILNVCIIQFC